MFLGTALPRPLAAHRGNPRRVALGILLWLLACGLVACDEQVSRTGNPTATITPPANQFTEYPLPTGTTHPADITRGHDGTLWFTDSTGLGRITPDGVITQ